MNTKTILLFGLFMVIASTFAHATLVLDRVQFDPAIITSGDEVDIVIEYHDNAILVDDDRISNPDYRFDITLAADDSITEKYITIQDAKGDNLYGTIYLGGNYNKKFRVKVSPSAPAGNYELRLIGQWYYKGVADKSFQEVRFKMGVKREGVSLNIANIISEPAKIRGGDKDVLLTAQIANSGDKTAKNVQVALKYPKGITASYSNNNELNLGVIEPSQQNNLQFYIDTDRSLLEGVYTIDYAIDYQDLDSNSYTTIGSFPLMIKKKPYLEVTSAAAEGNAGSEIELKVTVKNIGEEKTEAADIRIVKQSSQPFEMDVRSSYLGQLKPGEEATAVFMLKADKDAEITTHNLNLAIRAKGDLEEGDSNIYTFSDSASVKITGRMRNPFPMYGAIFIVLVIAVSFLFSRKSAEKQRR
ncbi:MAG: hypothetical protein NDI94_04860 [Candidatus Woesearchaeota archaeon]|nr:hypothetical protein [Candidatus Woesearchaeota archaeon]